MKPENRPDQGVRDAEALEELVAFLDEELEEPARQAMAAQISLDPRMRNQAEALKRAWDLLDYLPRAEASAEFTERTLSRLEVAVPDLLATEPVASGRSTGASQPVALPPRQRRWLLLLGWVSLLSLASGLGYLAATRWPSEPTDPRAVRPEHALADAINDLQVIEHLPLYQYLDDLTFLQKLNDAGLLATMSARPTRISSEQRSRYLRQQLARFQTLPASRQEQIRTLDRQLQATPFPRQRELRRTLEQFAQWMEGLSQDERASILQANPAQRLERIEQITTQQWVASLPQARRSQLQQTAPTQRAALMEHWREEQRLWQQEWDWAREHWDELRNPRLLSPFMAPAFQRQLKKFIRDYLRPQLTHTEHNWLQQAQQSAQAGNHLRLLWVVAELAERHPILPGPARGPTTYDELPQVVQAQLFEQGEVPDLEPAVGRWPDYAIAVTDWLRQQGKEPAVPLGPSRPEEFDPAIQVALQRLERQLRRAGAHDALAKLRDTHGRWPDYPRLVGELARQYNQPIPQVMLPGAPERWDKLRLRHSR